MLWFTCFLKVTHYTDLKKFLQGWQLFCQNRSQIASNRPDAKVRVREGARNPLRKAGNSTNSTCRGKKKGDMCKNENSEKTEMAREEKSQKDLG